MSVCSHGVLQLYDGWQNQENVPLIEEHSTSRSTLNMGWTSLLIGLVCFRKIKAKAEIGKSNPKTETDLFIPNLWDSLANRPGRRETDCSYHTNTPTPISVFQCVKSKTFDPDSQTQQSLESGCGACVFSSCAYTSSTHVCVFTLFTFH